MASKRCLRTLNRHSIDSTAIDTERRRLNEGLAEDETVLGCETVSIFFECDENSSDVLGRALEIMRSVNELADRPLWPSLDEISNALPPWFMDTCVTERECQKLKAQGEPIWSLPQDRWSSAQLQEPWTLGCLSQRMDPKYREWIWFSSEVRSSSQLLVHIDASKNAGAAIPRELLVLMAAAGAVDYREADHIDDRIYTDATTHDSRAQEWKHRTSGLVDMSQNALLVERQRLERGLGDGEGAIGMLPWSVRFICREAPDQVLERVSQIMRTVNQHGLADRWPSDLEWPKLLPAWFVEAFAPANKASSKDPSDRLAQRTSADVMADRWTLNAWMFWMGPENREWLWMTGCVDGDTAVLVSIDLLGDPYPSAPPALLMLFAVCGAGEYEEVDAFDPASVASEPPPTP